MSRALDCGIVGAGTAGAALALFLARAGARVTLYEAVPDPKPIGAGIVLQPSGQAVLGMLGLLGPILDRGARLDRLHCVRALGPDASAGLRTVVDLDYRVVGEGTFGLGLHRGALFAVLHDAVAREPSITLRCGTEIDEVRGQGERREVVASTGEVVGEHDVVVIADGAGSDLRTSDALPRRMRPYTWGAMWFVAPDPELVFRGQLYQILRGAQRMMGLLPTGTAPTETGPVVSLYWSVREDRVDEVRRSFDVWKREVVGFDPRAKAIVDHITAPEQLLFTRYRDVTSPSGVWHGGRTVRIGDAAHAMSPQLGQGANLALIDAATLAAALGDLDVAAVPSALAAYSVRRKAQLGYYQWATRWLTPFFQGDSGLLALVRDLGMPIGMKIPWVRTQMVTSMAGVHRGIFRAPMTLEPKRLVAG